MTQPSGWYNDPQDPSLLRYWDGVVWSDHVSPRVSPTVEKSTIGMPYGVIPAAARPQASGSQGSQGAPVSARQDTTEQPGSQWQAYGPGSGSPAAPQLGWQSQQPTTPDGVMLSAWWPRVTARLLDVIFTFVLSLPFAGWFYYRYVDAVVSWSKDIGAGSGSGSAPLIALPPWEVYRYAFTAALIGILIAGAYEVYFLTRTGATPGKKIVGISVRRRDAAGPVPMNKAVIRSAVYFGMSLVSIFASLIDVLWPLWDDKNQAIHDKVAATNVVVGPQPRRDT